MDQIVRQESARTQRSAAKPVAAISRARSPSVRDYSAFVVAWAMGCAK